MNACLNKLYENRVGAVELRLYELLLAHDGQSTVQLVAKSRISNFHVSAALDLLVHKNFVTREGDFHFVNQYSALGA